METFCGCPKMIKTKNKKKQIINLHNQYISQIKFDLHKTFRKTSCGYPMMIKKTYKQTKRKQVCESTISQANQVRSSQKFYGNFLWVSQDDPSYRRKPNPPNIKSGPKATKLFKMAILTPKEPLQHQMYFTKISTILMVRNFDFITLSMGPF